MRKCARWLAICLAVVLATVSTVSTAAVLSFPLALKYSGADGDVVGGMPFYRPIVILLSKRYSPLPRSYRRSLYDSYSNCCKLVGADFHVVAEVIRYDCRREMSELEQSPRWNHDSEVFSGCSVGNFEND